MTSVIPVITYALQGVEVTVRVDESKNRDRCVRLLGLAPSGSICETKFRIADDVPEHQEADIIESVVRDFKARIANK